MNFKEYRDEIELIEKQNNVEDDLYNIVWSFLRMRKGFKMFSLRNISKRKRTVRKNEQEKLFWGISGFPDFIILDKDYITDKPYKSMIYGVIEMKHVGEEVNIEQLKGHLFSFNKVLFTNGIKWGFYTFSPNRLETDLVEKLENRTYYSRKTATENEYAWTSNDERIFSYLGSSSEINEKFKVWEVVLKEKDSSGKYLWIDSKWEELLKKLEEIKWN